MSYEEKIKIYQSMIRNLEKELKNYEGTPYFEDEEFKIRERINMHKEELRLYSQASKVDEYEAKAKAYDSLKNNLEKEVETLTGEVSGFPYVDAPIESAISHFEYVLEMMKNYESGESDD